MSDQRAFRGVWIPAEIWMNRSLTLQEKVMLIEIDSLQHPERGCFKSNKSFADFFGISASRVSEVISSLANKGWVRVEQIREGKACVERRIYISKDSSGGYSENGLKGIRYPEEPIRDPEEGYSENAEERGSDFRGSNRGSVKPLASGDAKPKKKHQIPEGFEPNDTNRRIAEEQGVNLDSELENFKDYHGAKGSTFRDWNLALNTWIRNAGRFKARDKAANPNKPQAKYHNLQASADGLDQRDDGTYSL